MVQGIFHRATNCGTIKNKSKVVAPTFGERFLSDDEHSKLLMNSNLSQSRTQQLRHISELQQTCDAITYPLMSEFFNLLERDLESTIDRQNFGVDFESKQIWKRCCKKSVDHYNANPSLTLLIAIKVQDQRPVRWSFWRLTSSHFFLAIARKPSGECKSGSEWGVTRAVVAQGNPGDRPIGIFAKNNPQI